MTAAGRKGSKGHFESGEDGALRQVGGDEPKSDADRAGFGSRTLTGPCLPRGQRSGVVGGVLLRIVGSHLSSCLSHVVREAQDSKIHTGLRERQRCLNKLW